MTERRAVTMLRSFGFVLGAFGLIALLRIPFDAPIHPILIPGCLVVRTRTPFVPRTYVSAAFDAGTMATGPVAVNLVWPRTTGLATVSHGRTTPASMGMIRTVARTKEG